MVVTVAERKAEAIAKRKEGLFMSLILNLAMLSGLFWNAGLFAALRVIINIHVGIDFQPI